MATKVNISSSQRRVFNILKERRFTTTARVLGELKASGVSVQVIDQKGAGVAWWQPIERRIVLNDAEPHTTSESKKLIYERAKLYHELFHVMFTTHDAERVKMSIRSKNPNQFMWICNALEDGRIEHHGCKLYEGTQWYIRTILKDLVTADSAASGLLLYVRTQLWRNQQERDFWAKHEAKIQEAITCNSSMRVWKIAFDIVEDIAKPPKPQPKQKPPQQQDEDDQQDGGENESGTPTSGTEEQEQGEDSGEESDGAGEESENDSADDADFDDTIPEKQPEQSTSSAPPSDNTVDINVEELIDELIDEAFRQVDEEVSEELVDLEAEVLAYKEPQQYANPAEESDAGTLVETFNSILVESDRTHFAPVKRGGSLDARRMVDVVTGGTFMHRREEKLSQPHIVLAIDESLSMGGVELGVSSAARILNGAISNCGATSLVVGFGMDMPDGSQGMKTYGVVPVDGFECDGGCTPTHLALEAAHKWFNDQNARRGMVIVITDGMPTSKPRVQTAFDQLKGEGYYVLNVLLARHAKQMVDQDSGVLIKTFCHEYIYVEDVANLVRVLEAPLQNFMSGAF